jgi:hypothetical protein
VRKLRVRLQHPHMYGRTSTEVLVLEKAAPPKA